MLRYSNTLVLVAIVVGLLCYLTFVDNRQPGTQQLEEDKNILLKFEPEDVTELEITNVHGTFIFIKTNNHWEIRKPVNAVADESIIEEILSQISATRPQRILKVEGMDKDDANLKEWGLSPASERVVIHTAKKTYELLIGRKMATSDSVYSRASGRKDEPVRIVPHTVKDVVEKDLSDFRSRNVFDFDQDKVTKIATKVGQTATSPGQQGEVDFKDGKWTLQMPLVARASGADVLTLLTKALAAHVIDFVTDDPSNLSQYGLTSPSATFSVSVKPDETDVLQIGSTVPDKPDQVYAQRLKSNSIFTLSRSSVDELLDGVANVRDRHILPFDPGKVTGLTYTYGTQKVEVRKEDGLWKTVGQSAGPADVAKITDLLVKLSQLETTPALKDSAPDLKPFGLDQPLGKITLQSPEFKPDSTLSLLIGKSVNKVLYVRNSTEPFLYTLDEGALNFVPASNVAIRDARVINLESTKAQSMTITIVGTPPVVLTRSPGGTWTATNVKDRMVNGQQADVQLGLVCQLQAKAWLGPVLPSYGLDKPILSIAVTTDKKAAAVHIGAALPDGGRVAQVDGEKDAFELAGGDYAILNSSSLQLIPSVLGTNAPASKAPVPQAPDKK